MEELRKQNRRVIIICRADWDVPSTQLESTLLLDSVAISAVKASQTVVMLVDMTHPLGEKNDEFFRKFGADPLCFLQFTPGVTEPVVTNHLLRPSEFVQLLHTGD